MPESLALSEAERSMLLWSESDGESNADPRIASELAAQLSDEEYEAKISGLLARAFAADSAANAHALDEWRHARDVLAQGDHYILIMIDRATGATMKRWWQFWK